MPHQRCVKSTYEHVLSSFSIGLLRNVPLRLQQNICIRVQMGLHSASSMAAPGFTDGS